MIRIGIVGCGRILNAHLQGYKQLRALGIDNFRITALVARKEEDALMFHTRGQGPTPRAPVLAPETGDPLAAPHTYLDDFQDDVDVKIYTDYRQMIEDDVVDAVNDFTTLALHHQIADVAFGAGKHLLAQKPLAISVAAARRMVEAADARKLTLGTFENVRQMQIVRAAAWAVEHGLIGDPQMALIGSLGGIWSPTKVVADTPWRHKKLQAGGGGSIDIGVHQMHWLRYVFGEIAWVQAITRTFEPLRYRYNAAGNVIETVDVNVDDTYMAAVGFENDAVGQLLWSWAGHGAELPIPHTPAFFGSKGCIKGDQLIDDNGNRESLIEHFELDMSDAERARFFPLGLTDPYAVLQLDWLRAIESGGHPETSGREGLHDLACAMGMIESSLLGRRVALDELLSGAVSDYQREIDEYYGLI